MAPEIRACSCPFLKSTRVGMLIILKRAASACSCSVLTYQPDLRLELPGCLDKYRSHHLARPAPRCPEVSQQRDVAVLQLALETLSGKLHRHAAEQITVALAAFSLCCRLVSRNTVYCITLGADYLY